SVRLDEAVLLAATTYLAAGSLRSIFFWAGAVAVVLPRHVSALMAAGDGAASTTPRQGWLHATVVGLLVLSAVLGQPGLPLFDLRNRALGGTVRRGGTEHRLLSAQNSVHLVDRLAAEGGSGRIFHGQSLGGLLDFRLGARRPASPRRVAFVDQRMTLVPPRLWDAYFEISEARAGWRQALQKWEVDTLLLNPDGQRRLVQAVEASADWRLVAIGSGHLRFERRSD
ncbi:MAG: hypothetical protein ABEL76_09045, partial [Bradymonadaceae bacterium]